MKKINKFNVGDKVKILLEGVNIDYPKTYKIEKVEYTNHISYNLPDYYVYKLQGVPYWFKEEHLEVVNETK